MSAADETRQSPAPAKISPFRHDVARVFVDSLKANDITFSVLLPDSVLHPLNELLLADAAVQTVICSREDEGIAIAAGAGWGGRRSTVSMEGSAIGMSGLILARAVIQRSPTLILASHSTDRPHDGRTEDPCRYPRSALYPRGGLSAAQLRQRRPKALRQCPLVGLIFTLMYCARRDTT
jgi:hypothetical protein